MSEMPIDDSGFRMPKPSKFREELEQLINKHSKENESNTPDFLLAGYLVRSLMNFDTAVYRRDQWYGIDCTGTSVRIKKK